MINYAMLHFWELPPDTYVKINVEVVREFILKVLEIFDKRVNKGRRDKALVDWLFERSENHKVWKKKYDRRQIHYWRNGNFIPLWVIIELSKLLNNKNILKKIERHVIAFKSRSGRTIHSFKNRQQFPLRITPEFVSLYFHLIGDGYVGGKKSTASYFQKNHGAREQFLQKLKNCFGDFTISSKSYENCVVEFPFIIARIIKKYLRNNGFYSADSKLPKIIYNLDRLSKVAGLAAIIVDEGNIDDTIMIGMYNYDLIVQLRELIISLGYKCGKVSERKTVWNFSISNKSLNLFKNDLNNLSKSFPTCDLSFKRINFDILYEIHQRGTDNTVYNWDIIEKQICDLLQNKELTCPEIRVLLKLEFNTAISHIALLRFLRKMRRNEKIKHNLNGNTLEWYKDSAIFLAHQT